MLTDLSNSLTNTLQNLFSSSLSDENVTQAITEICKQLVLANISTSRVALIRSSLENKIKTSSKGSNKYKILYNSVFNELVELVDSKKKPFLPQKGVPNVIVFVGLQGAGKTTTVCKYAKYYSSKFKTGIVCADTFRAGAFDQIKQNATKINIPFYGNVNESDPVRVAMEGVEMFKNKGFELILVDTSGRHTQEGDLFVEMKQIMKKVKPSNVVFVVDSSIGQSAEVQARGFKENVEIGGVILTKMDGSSRGGGALSSVAAVGCPVEFVGSGEGMDDLDIFKPKRFIGKILGRGDLETLAEKMAELKIDEKEMIKKIKKGNLSLGDYRDQLKQIMSLGPLSKLIGMIPGCKNLPIPSEHAFKRILIVFDSFNKKELQCDSQIFQKEPSRIVRVAKGSGSSIKEVNNMLIQYEQMIQLFNKMKNIPGFFNILNNDMSSMTLQQKEKMKNKAKTVLPKEFADSMSSFFDMQK